MLQLLTYQDVHMPKEPVAMSAQKMLWVLLLNAQLWISFMEENYSNCCTAGFESPLNEQVYMLHGMGVETGVSLEKLIEAGSFISSHLGRETMSRWPSLWTGVNKKHFELLGMRECERQIWIIFMTITKEPCYIFILVTNYQFQLF